MKEVDGVPESPHEPSGTDMQSLSEPQLDRNGEQSPIDESQTTVPCVNSSKDNLSSPNGSSTQQLNHSPSQPHPTFPLPSSNSSSSQQMWEQRSKLFIGGLTVNTTDQMLNHYFAKFGEVIDAVVMKDRATARSRGFGFVTFRDPEMLNAAQASRPHEIDGKQVETKRAMPREDSANPESHVTVNKIFCGAIKREVTEVEVREYFSRFGRVTECELVHRRDTGESRGFAFITFDDYDPVDQILLARPHLLGGKTVDVRKALTRDQQVELKQKQQHQLASRQHSTGGLVASHGNYLPSSNPLQAATVLHSTFYCSPTSVNPGVGSGAPSAHHHHHQHHHHQSLHHSPATSLDAATALSSPTAAALLSPNYPMAAAAFSAMFSQAGAFGPSQYNPLLHNPASLTSYPPSPHAMSAVPSAGATTHLLNNAAAAAWMNAVTNSGSASTPTSPLLTSWPLLDGGASLYGSPLSPVAFFNPFNGMCYAPTLSAAAPHNTAFSTATFHQHSEAPAPVFPSAAAPVENGTTTSAPLATPVNGSKVSSTQKATETAVIPAKEKISVGENDRAEPVENGTVEVDGLASDVETRLTCSPNKDL